MPRRNLKNSSKTPPFCFTTEFEENGSSGCFDTCSQGIHESSFLLWMEISSTKHKIPTRVYGPFTFVLSENVFCQGMVVLLNPVCVLLSGMLHAYKSDVSVAVFKTWWSPKHWLRWLKIIELFGPVFLKSWEVKAEGNISYNYRFHIVTRFN